MNRYGFAHLSNSSSQENRDNYVGKTNRITHSDFSLQNEYTFLLYLNPHWTADMYAETAFFDYASQQDTELGEDTVTRKYGNQSYEFISKF